MAPGRGVGGFGGWLSMAPQTDVVPMSIDVKAAAAAGTPQTTPVAISNDKENREATPCQLQQRDHITDKHVIAQAQAQSQAIPPSNIKAATGSRPGFVGTGHFSPSFTPTSPRIHSPLVPLDARRASLGTVPPRVPEGIVARPTATEQAGPSSGSKNGIKMSPAAASTSATRASLPRTNARFSVGFESSFAATPSSLAPSSPRSGDGDDSPPPFDVRASFAPMPAYSAAVPSNARRKSENSHEPSGKRLMQDGAKVGYSLPTQDDHEAAAPIQRAGKSGLFGLQSDRVHMHDEEGDYGDNIFSPDPAEEGDVEDEDDGHRVEIGGRRWKGKTANAIELEMEALGDHTVMSYAPDAVYLASRLEGLRRNLEAGGERSRKPAWLSDDEGSASEPVKRHASAAGVPQLVATKLQVDSPGPSMALYRKVSDSPVAQVGATQPDPAAATAITTASDSMDIDAPPQDVQEQAASVSPDLPMEMQGSAQGIAPAAKEAALDARVEIRTLRRPDLEQVRELHCYHGDGDKVDSDTYTTSAAFLLRLLVDEHYVCLVAVAKPLPEPQALPTQFVPFCPPPSLDMPPARSSFLLAGQSQTQRQDSRLTTVLNNRLAPRAHFSAFADHAPAPRSFGAGPGSDTASSSADDVSDEERRRQSSLFERAKAASTHITGETSSPDDDNAVSDDDNEAAGTDAPPATMPAVPEEDEQGGIQRSRTASHSTLQQATPKRTSVSYRPRTVLAGPTFDVAPPRAVRVMGAPPPSGVPSESETILGVAAARIKVVQRAEDEWGASGLFAPSAAKDSSWPGMDPRGETKSIATREAHILSLSVLPGERGQGLGARLLDRLLDECRRRTAGPRISMATGSTIKEEVIDAAGRPEKADEASPRASAPPRAHQNAPMRTVLEVHPSNEAAMTLYKNKGFEQIQGNRGIVRHFFRGDQRIPTRIRLQVGGSDAVRLERREEVS